MSNSDCWQKIAKIETNRLKLLYDYFSFKNIALEGVVRLG
jgi:hypothetical protein